MADEEKVIKGLEQIINDPFMKARADYWVLVCSDAIALLKEQEEAINDLTETIRQLNQHINELSEYMTPYGKVKDIKAYADSLKEQGEEGMQAVIKCRDCKHYTANVLKNNGYNYGECHKLAIGLGVYVVEDWFCAEGERRTDE